MRVLLLEDSYNDENFLMTKFLKPDDVVYLTSRRGYHAGYFDDYADSMSEQFSATVSYQLVDRPEALIQKDFLEELQRFDAILLNSSNSLLAASVQCALQRAKKSYYVIDRMQEALYQFTDKGIMLVEQELDSLVVDDYFDITGGSILHKTTLVNDDDKIIALTDLIADNQKKWRRLKKILTFRDVFTHDRAQHYLVRAHLARLNRHDAELFNWLLTFMKRIGLLKLSTVSKNVVDMRFKTPQYKHFLFVTGSWLEALTYHTVRLVKQTGDVQTGVSFAWDTTQTIVRNEVDVLATVAGRLYAISCKDTARYSVETLNELAVYAEKIGGPDAKKLLVTTKLPRERSLTARAADMGIELIIFEGNVPNFRKQIERFLDADDLMRES